MWIMQLREEKGDIWEVLKEVKPFALEALVTVEKAPSLVRGNMTSSPLPSSSPPSSSSSTQKVKARKHKFRIVLHYNRLDMVVAVAADTFIANQHWTFIQDNLVAQFQALLSTCTPAPPSPPILPLGFASYSPTLSTPTSTPPQSPILHFSASTTCSPISSPSSSPSSTSSFSSSPSHSFGFASLKSRSLKKPKKKKLKDSSPTSTSYLSTPPAVRRSDEDQAVYQFLTLKFTTLTKVETQKELEQDEKMMKKWNMPTTEMGSLATFQELFEIDEPILAFFNCSLWRKRIHLGGLYVSQSFLSFGSTPLRRKFMFPFSGITQLEATNEKDELHSVFPDAIKIVTKGKTYLLFQFVGAHEVLPTITDLWHKAIAEAATCAATGFPVVSSRVSSPRESTSPERANLHIDSRSRTATSALNNPMMSMPLGEAPAELDKCQLRMKGDVVGAIGQFYVSFKWISFSASSASVIIPFRYVTGMTKSQNRNTIRVETPTNSCKFAFSSFQKRQSVFKVLNDIWETNKSIQESFTHCNTVDEALQNIDNEKSEDLKSKIITVMKKDMRISVDSACDRQWNVYLAKHGRGVDMIKTSQLKYLIRDGIPNSLRRKMWQICSLSIYRMAYPSVSHSYASLVRRVDRHLASSKDSEAIEKDLRRSLRGIFIYDDEKAMGSLRRVLKAFSLRNTQIGYCQSMNMIAALLLLYMTEEEAYWLLCTLCEDILPEYYSENMVGCLVDQQVFQSITAECLPKLFQQAQELGVSLEIVSIPWFLCIFINILPWNSMLRILDRLFAEGSVVLFQVGVSLLHVNEAKLLGAKDNMQFMDILKHQLSMEWSPEFEAIMKTFAREITSEKIKMLRRTYRPGILRTLGIAGLPEGVTISAHGSIMLTINSDMLQLLQNTENLNKLITKFMGIPDNSARTRMVHAPVSRSYSHTALGTSDDVAKAKELSRHSCVPEDDDRNVAPHSRSWVASSHKGESPDVRKQFLGNEKLIEMAKSSQSSPSLLREEGARSSPPTSRPIPPPRTSMRLKAMTEMAPPAPTRISATPAPGTASPSTPPRPLPQHTAKNLVAESPSISRNQSDAAPSPPISTPAKAPLDIYLHDSAPSLPPSVSETIAPLELDSISNSTLNSAVASSAAIEPTLTTSVTPLSAEPAPTSAPTAHSAPGTSSPVSIPTKPPLPTRSLTGGWSSSPSLAPAWARKGAPAKQAPNSPTSTSNASSPVPSPVKGSPSRGLQSSGSQSNVFSSISTTNPGSSSISSTSSPSVSRPLPGPKKGPPTTFRGTNPSGTTTSSNPINRALPQPTRQASGNQLMKSPSPKEGSSMPPLLATSLKLPSPTISPTPSPVPSPTPSPIPSPRGSSNPTPFQGLISSPSPKDSSSGVTSVPMPTAVTVSSSKSPPSPRGGAGKTPSRNQPTTAANETSSWLGRGTGTSIRGTATRGGPVGRAGTAPTDGGVRQLPIPSGRGRGTGPGAGPGAGASVFVSTSSTHSGSTTSSSPSPSPSSPSPSPSTPGSVVVSNSKSMSIPVSRGAFGSPSSRGGPAVRGPGPSRFPRGSTASSPSPVVSSNSATSST